MKSPKNKMFNPTCVIVHSFRETILTVVTELGLFVEATNTEIQVECVLAILARAHSVVVQ